MDLVQIVSLVGALLILAAYAGNQTGVITADRTAYNVANLVGAVILAWVAVVGGQYGFIVLEATWAAISLVALFRHRTKHRVADETEESSPL